MAEIHIGFTGTRQGMTPHRGTWATVRYACKVGKPVVMLWPEQGREERYA